MNATTAINGTESVESAAKLESASEVQNLVADVEDLLKKVTGSSDSDVAKLRARVQASLGNVRATLAASSQRLTDTARVAGTVTDDYVRKSPWQAVGLAAVAGALVGYLLSRR